MLSWLVTHFVRRSKKLLTILLAHLTRRGSKNGGFMMMSEAISISRTLYVVLTPPAKTRSVGTLSSIMRHTSLCVSLPFCLSSLSLFRSLLSVSVSVSLSFSLCLSLSRARSLSHTYPPTHTHNNIHTHTHTHTNHTHTPITHTHQSHTPLNHTHIIYIIVSRSFQCEAF